MLPALKTSFRVHLAFVLKRENNYVSVILGNQLFKTISTVHQCRANEVSGKIDWCLRCQGWGEFTGQEGVRLVLALQLLQGGG